MPGLFWFPDDYEYQAAIGYLLPCFVIGWAGARPRAVGELIYGVQHQKGGYTCGQVAVVGLVLPLRLNLERARVDPGPLLKELCVFAEVGHAGPDADSWLSPFFSRWYYTWGDVMPDEDLRTLDRTLAETYEGLPPARYGQEGYARFDPPPRERFLGWEAVVIVEDEDDPDDREPEGCPLVATSFAALDPLAEEIGRPPALHLLWANSD